MKTNMNAVTNEIKTAWLEQAKNVIAQGQSLTDFILHVTPENRPVAFKAYKLAERQMKAAA